MTTMTATIGETSGDTVRYGLARGPGPGGYHITVDGRPGDAREETTERKETTMATATKIEAKDQERLRAVLKRAGLSENAELTDAQRGRALSPEAGRLRSEASLRKFIMRSDARRANSRDALTTGQAIARVLGEADGPLLPREVARRILDAKLAPGLRGRTPEETIAARLYVGAKQGRYRKTEGGFSLGEGSR